MMPLCFARPSPPSGWPRDFHPQAIEHARHATKPLRVRGIGSPPRPVLTIQLGDDGSAPYGATPLAMEMSMSPLRRRMIEDMQIRNLTPNTQRVYISRLVRFARHFGKSPDRLGPAEIRAYLLHLAQEERLAASSIRSCRQWSERGCLVPIRIPCIWCMASDIASAVWGGSSIDAGPGKPPEPTSHHSRYQPGGAATVS